MEVIHNTQMEQLVTFPTEGMNILDLCLTTHPSIISTCKPIPGLSDHDTVFINLALSLHRIKNHPCKILLYKNADWDIIHNKLLDISEEYFQLNDTSPRGIEENWHFFTITSQKL